MKSLWVMALMLCTLLFSLPSPLFAAADEAVFNEEGIASWYTSDPDGPLTANGERFNPEALTAAHKSLKFGTVVRVFDQESNLQVDVRINDRGPYIDGRIIDLTPAAARAIDMYERGISKVILEIIYEPPVPESNYNRPGDTGWYKFQIGSFSNTQRVYELYMKLYALGFKPSIEIVNDNLVRLSIRWIEESQREISLQILKGMGISEVLVRGENVP